MDFKLHAWFPVGDELSGNNGEPDLGRRGSCGGRGRPTFRRTARLGTILETTKVLTCLETLLPSRLEERDGVSVNHIQSLLPVLALSLRLALVLLLRLY